MTNMCTINFTTSANELPTVRRGNDTGWHPVPGRPSVSDSHPTAQNESLHLFASLNSSRTPPCPRAASVNEAHGG